MPGAPVCPSSGPRPRRPSRSARSSWGSCTTASEQRRWRQLQGHQRWDKRDSLTLPWPPLTPGGAAGGGGPLPAALHPSEPCRSALRARYRKCISWRWRWGCSTGGVWSGLGRAAAAFPKPALPTLAELSLPSKTQGEGSPARTPHPRQAEQPAKGEHPSCLPRPPGPPMSPRQAESWTMGIATSASGLGRQQQNQVPLGDLASHPQKGPGPLPAPKGTRQLHRATQLSHTPSHSTCPASHGD